MRVDPTTKSKGASGGGDFAMTGHRLLRSVGQFTQHFPFFLVIRRLEAIASRSKDATRGSWPYY